MQNGGVGGISVEFGLLSDNARAREALRQCLPDVLRDATFSTCLKDDVTTKRWLTQLLFNITESSAPPLREM